MSLNKDATQAHNVALLQKKAFDVTFELETTQYNFIQKIGTGAYGVVCCAEHRVTEKRFAIKRIQSVFQHSVTIKRTLREIRLLRSFNHPNIISIRDLFLIVDGQIQSSLSDIHSLVSKDCDAYVVFELMQSDMRKIIDSKQQFTDDHIRYFMYQIMCGLNYIHAAGVIHRDLKPANILVNANCELKIGDFGMSRSISSASGNGAQAAAPRYNLTQYVMTRWYRAPELLMGQVTYSTGVDMWSTGCILAELYLGKALFRGLNDIQQVQVIVDQLGTPPHSFMTKVLPIVRSIIMQAGHKVGTPFMELFPNAPRKAIDLLSRLLLFEPEERWSANQCLKHLFLNKYRQPALETVCHNRLDFAYEDESDSIEKQKISLSEEILHFNSPSMTVSISPADSLSSKSSAHTDSTTVGSDSTLTSAQLNSNDVHMYSADASKNKEHLMGAHQSLLDSVLSQFETKDNIDSLKRHENNLNSKEKIHLVSEKKVKKPRKKKIKKTTCSDFTKEKLLSALSRPKVNTEKRKVTAAQRQKEREEKKKAKLGDKRKKQQKSDSKTNTLSPDDHKLLERWTKLHESKSPVNAYLNMDNISSNNTFPTAQPSIQIVPSDDPPQLEKYEPYVSNVSNHEFLSQLNVENDENDVDKQMSALSAEFSKANLSGFVYDKPFDEVDELVSDGWNTWLFGGSGDIECVDLAQSGSNIYFDQTLKIEGLSNVQTTQENAPNSAEAMNDWLSVLQDANATSVDLDEELPKTIDEIMWSTIGYENMTLNDQSAQSSFTDTSQSKSSHTPVLNSDLNN